MAVKDLRVVVAVCRNAHCFETTVFTCSRSADLSFSEGVTARIEAPLYPVPSPAAQPSSTEERFGVLIYPTTVRYQWDRLFAANGSLLSLQAADLLAPLTDPTPLALCRLGRLLRSFRQKRSPSPPSGMTTVATGQVLLAGPSPAGLAASFAAPSVWAVIHPEPRRSLGKRSGKPTCGDCPVLSIGFQGAAKRLSRCWRRPNSRIEGACHRLLRHHGVLRPHYQHHLARSGYSLLAGPPACVLRVTVRNGLLCGVSDFRHLFTAPRVSQITEYCRLPSV